MGEITKAMQIFETVHLPKSKVSYPLYLSQTRSCLETLDMGRCGQQKATRYM